MEIGIDSFAAASIGIGKDRAIKSMKALAELLERIGMETLESFIMILQNVPAVILDGVGWVRS